MQKNVEINVGLMNGYPYSKKFFIITTPDKTYFLKNRRHPDQISEESYDKNNEYENSLEDG